MKIFTPYTLLGLLILWLVVGGGNAALISSLGGSTLMGVLSSVAVVVPAVLCRLYGMWLGRYALRHPETTTCAIFGQLASGLFVATALAGAVLLGELLVLLSSEGKALPILVALSLVNLFVGLPYLAFIQGGQRYVFNLPENREAANAIHLGGKGSAR